MKESKYKVVKIVVNLLTGENVYDNIQLLNVLLYTRIKNMEEYHYGF